MLNLEELIETEGITEVNKVCAEYILIALVKAMKMDKVVEMLDNENCTIEQIRGVIFGENEDA